MAKCLCCYKQLSEGMVDYHPACARKLFGSGKAPVMPYRHDEIGELAKQIIQSQTTLTGVQAKLSLDVNRGGKNRPARFTIVGLWGRFILKPQSEKFSCLPEIEDVTMHMAEAAKIAVVPHGLVRFADGKLCYITRRIDRTGNGDKFPMEDMCQLTNRLTEYKYQGSYEQIAKVISRFSLTPQLDLVNFWEIVVFAWITGNADMHLKNFSLYSKGEGYTLAPAYDLLSTALVMPEDTEELALALNGKKRKIKRGDFETVMLRSGIPAKAIANIAKKFRKSLPVWLATIDASFLPDDTKKAYKRLVLKRALLLKSPTVFP